LTYNSFFLLYEFFICFAAKCCRLRGSPPFQSDDYSYSSDLVQDTKNRLRRLESEADVSNCVGSGLSIHTSHDQVLGCSLRFAVHADARDNDTRYTKLYTDCICRHYLAIVHCCYSYRLDEHHITSRSYSTSRFLCTTKLADLYSLTLAENCPRRKTNPDCPLQKFFTRFVTRGPLACPPITALQIKLRSRGGAKLGGIILTTELFFFICSKHLRHKIKICNCKVSWTTRQK
jgi:hypothetical protein